MGAHNLKKKDYLLAKPKEAFWPKYPDIGVIVLKHPVNLSDTNIGTICLPSIWDKVFDFFIKYLIIIIINFKK